MQISANDWLKYIRKLSAIDGKAANLMQSWMVANGLGDTGAMISYAHALSTKYGEAAASLACEMYDAVAAAQGASVAAAEPAATATYQETARAVMGTLKNQRNTVPDTVGRLVKQAGADTTLKNAARDGAQFAWVPHGDTCAFCMMLASRGWQRMSKKALRGGHAEHIHAHCDCTYAIRFGDSGGVEGYDPDRYLDAYENAEGATWQDKVNAMRREQYAEHKDAINAQKRAAYAASKEGLSGSRDGGIIKKKTAAMPASIEIQISDKQFGKKVGKHAVDFGLNPSKEADRAQFRKIINEIYSTADEVRVGNWRGQDGDVLFYIKGEDVLVMRENGAYITTLRGGVNNARVKNARKRSV